MIIIEEKGLKQIGSVDELEAMVKEIIAANPGQTAEYRSGKEKLFGFFVGQMMQKTKGKGNPQLINDLDQEAFEYPALVLNLLKDVFERNKL